MRQSALDWHATSGLNVGGLWAELDATAGWLAGWPQWANQRWLCCLQPSNRLSSLAPAVAKAARAGQDPARLLVELPPAGQCTNLEGDSGGQLGGFLVGALGGQAVRCSGERLAVSPAAPARIHALPGCPPHSSSRHHRARGGAAAGLLPAGPQGWAGQWLEAWGWREPDKHACSNPMCHPDHPGRPNHQSSLTLPTFPARHPVRGGAGAAGHHRRPGAPQARRRRGGALVQGLRGHRAVGRPARHLDASW